MAGKYYGLTLDEEVVRRRFSHRESWKTISTSLSITVAQCKEIAQTYIDECRAKNVDIIDTAFWEQKELIDLLIQRCMVQLLRRFDHNILKCILLLLERQAKLMGLDKAGKPVNPVTSEWFGNMSNEELIEKARTMGLQIPQEFVLHG